MATKKKNIDVTIVITAHLEGLLAYRTLHAWQHTRAFATKRGITSKLIVVLNSASPETFQTVIDHQLDLDIDQILTTTFSNPGPARNAGIATVTTPYTAIWDADDIPSENWLAAAVEYLKKSPTGTVVHPEITTYFGAQHFWYRLPNQSDPWCDVRQLIIHHYWSSAIVTRTALLHDQPFVSAEIGSGVGPEDWEWNARVIALGATHHVVPGTVRFYRSKSTNSLNNEHAELGQLPSANAFFADPARFTPRKPFTQRAYRFAPRKVQRIIRRLFKPTAEQLPAWVKRAALAVVDYEPEITALIEQSPPLWEHRAPSPLPGVTYCDLLRQWPEKRAITHLFILPWLLTGGADRVALAYIGSVAADPNNRVAVLVTQLANSVWREKLPKNVLWVEFDQSATTMPMPWQRVVVARLIMQRQPKVVHIINARAGWEALQHHGLSVTRKSTWYASVFCDDLLPNGEWYGYARQYLGDTHHYLASVLTENETYRQTLLQLFGLPSTKIITHYSTAPTTYKQPSTHPERALLWAGRLDEQKRPDLLARIAERLPDVRFDVYGSRVLSANPAIERPLHAQPNIRLCGPFTNFNALPHDRYAGFIYTSQWDGLPIILLEATAAGLPVVAPNVGGVSELIRQPSGYLIDRFDDIDQYVSAIKHLLAHREYAVEKVRRAQLLLKERHSIESWHEQLATVNGYVHPAEISTS